MSLTMANCAIAVGSLAGGNFGATGQEGNWAIFSGSFSAGPKPIFHKAPRMIATPILDHPFDVGAFLVCGIRSVSLFAHQLVN